MLPIMTIVPIVQLIVLSYAADNEVKNVKLAIVNHDQSAFSRKLIEKVRVSNRFIISELAPSFSIADNQMQKGDIDIILVIPNQFEKDYISNGAGQIQLLVNAINGQGATVGSGYLNAIIQSFNKEISIHSIPHSLSLSGASMNHIKTESSYWYNSDLNYKYFMAPGIIGELVTILIMLLTAMNIVREREIGTIEQINVTPIKKWQFILGKMIPFLIIGFVLLVVGLTASKLIFNIPMRGNLMVVFTYTLLHLTAVLGLGLFISNLSDTQQQAMFTTFFFVIIFILMSGLFTPIESMPDWAQYLTIPNPIAHYVNVMRSVLLKGSGFADVAYNFRVITILAIIFNGLAIWSYKKVS